MKTSGWILLAAVTTFSLSFCKEKNPDPSGQTEEGKANIVLTAGGEQYKITGPCGWASAGGAKYIGANEAGNSLKTFSVFFNIESLPEKTTTYTLVEDVFDEDPTHITMNITEMRNGGLFEYASTDASGTLTLTVSGKKVMVDLAGITLKATTESNLFTSLNTGAFSKPGTLSGTLELYRE